MRGGTAAHLARRGERAGWASLHSRQLDREMLRQFDRARSRGRCDAADGRLWLLQGVSDGTASARQLGLGHRSEEHTSELQSLMRISYAVFCLKKKKNKTKKYKLISK